MCRLFLGLAAMADFDFSELFHGSLGHSRRDSQLLCLSIESNCTIGWLFSSDYNHWLCLKLGFRAHDGLQSEIGNKNRRKCHE